MHHSAPLVQLEDGTFYGVTFDGGDVACVRGCGTIFQMDSLGNTFAVLHAFTGADGEGPTSIMAAADGNLWGTTFTGGANDCGTLFKMSPAGDFAPVHSFDSLEGCNPWGAPAQADDGNLYGIVSSQANGGGGLYRVVFPSTVTPLVGFDPALLRFSRSALIQASDGNLDRTAPGDSGGGLGALFRSTTAGSVSIVHSFTGGTADGSSPFGAPFEASDGALYGTTRAGGTNGDGIMYRFGLPPSGRLTVRTRSSAAIRWRSSFSR